MTFQFIPQTIHLSDDALRILVGLECPPGLQQVFGSAGVSIARRINPISRKNQLLGVLLEKTSQNRIELLLLQVTMGIVLKKPNLDSLKRLSLPTIPFTHTMRKYMAEERGWNSDDWA